MTRDISEGLKLHYDTVTDKQCIPIHIYSATPVEVKEVFFKESKRSTAVCKLFCGIL